MTATAAVVLAALGVSGVASAAGNGASPSSSQKAQAIPAPAHSTERPGVESRAPEGSATDPDNVQYTAPGDPDAKTASASKTVAAPSAAQTSQEAAGTEQSAGSEQSGSEVGGSETSNNDGPGGHADEPGNANADHQFQGQE